MATNIEKEVQVSEGLGNADPSQVLAGTTFTSETGFNQTGTLVPDTPITTASGISYDNSTSGLTAGNVQSALDETNSNLKSHKHEISDVNGLQTIADNSQFVKKVLTAKGWYRIGKYVGTLESEPRGRNGNSCEIIMKRTYNYKNNEEHRLLLKSITESQKFVPISCNSATLLFKKIRYVYDSINAYIDVYYDSDTGNYCSFLINDSKDYMWNWQATTPTIVEETVEGETVSTVFDIPTNANPVTDLDLNAGLNTTERNFAQTIDLSDTSVYDENTWYPCTGTPISSHSYTFERINVSVHLNSGTKPSWSSHDNGFSCDLDLLVKGRNWGGTDGASICFTRSCNFTIDNIMPCGFEQMGNSSTPVLYLRGGGRYYVYTSYKCEWTPRTAEYTVSSQSVTPKTEYPRIIITKSAISANLDGNADASRVLVDISGTPLQIGESTKPVYFANGKPVACESLPYASKSIYNDTSVSINRDSNSTVGAGSIAISDSKAVASGICSYAHGGSQMVGSSGNIIYTTASGDYSHAEGKATTASGVSSHAEGFNNTASGNYSHVEGGSNTASGYCSHAEGEYSDAIGSVSHAGGSSTEALDYQYAIGHLNNTTTATANVKAGTSSGTAFVIGNGAYGSKSNAFRVTGEGNVYATNATISTGADYAEYFEWADGNTNNEDRVGHFVTLDENNPKKIRIANEGDYLLGIISGMPSVIGNGDECWKQRYVLDEFGRYITEEFEYEEKIYKGEDENRNPVFETVTKTGTKYKENPDYDSTKSYTPRKERAEWDAVGMLGVLSVYDDGSCEVNGYCKCGVNGIATATDRGLDTYRVIKRIADNVIEVVFK